MARGEGLQITPDGQVGPAATIDAAEVTAWRQRRLMFRKDRLADVVREFNRYSNATQLAVEEPDVAERRLSGVFDADDPKSLLLFLAEDGTLEFEQRGRRTVIRSLRR
jgi:transmembrane sensor